MTASIYMFRVPVITYHSIDDSGSVISTSPATFKRQIAALSRSGYVAMTLGQLAEAIDAEGTLPPKPVVLTFDDGFKNFYSDAFPVLDEYGFAATVFVVTGHCGGHNDWGGNPRGFRRSELLSWNEIRELYQKGVEFGAHSKTHKDLTRISLSEARSEIEESGLDLEIFLGVRTKSFAYPFGKVDEAIKRIVAKRFAVAASTTLGKVTPKSDLYALERVDAYYLSSQRLFDRLESTTFDSYLRFRQFMRNAKSYASRPAPNPDRTRNATI